MESEMHSLSHEELQMIVGGVVNPSNPSVAPDITGNGGGDSWGIGNTEVGRTIIEIFKHFLDGRKP